jgi:hypothetical protein
MKKFFTLIVVSMLAAPAFAQEVEPKRANEIKDRPLSEQLKEKQEADKKVSSQPANVKVEKKGNSYEERKQRILNSTTMTDEQKARALEGLELERRKDQERMKNTEAKKESEVKKAELIKSPAEPKKD